MLGHTFLYEAIKEAKDNNILTDCDYLSMTDWITIPQGKNYAVIITEQPFDFRQAAKQTRPVGQLEEYVVNILMLYETDNRITEENYLAARNLLHEEAKKIVKAIAERSKTFNKVSNVTTGKADVMLLPIESRQFMWLPVPFTVTTIN